MKTIKTTILALMALAIPIFSQEVKQANFKVEVNVDGGGLIIQKFKQASGGPAPRDFNYASSSSRLQSVGGGGEYKGPKYIETVGGKFIILKDQTNFYFSQYYKFTASYIETIQDFKDTNTIDQRIDKLQERLESEDQSWRTSFRETVTKLVKSISLDTETMRMEMSFIHGGKSTFYYELDGELVHEKFERETIDD